MDCSPPGPSIHGILQARILEWVAIPLCQLLSSFFHYFVIFLSSHIFHSLSFFLFYSFFPIYSSLSFFFILLVYNFSYFSLPLLSLSLSPFLSPPLSLSFLHSFPLLSYFPLSCSVTLKQVILFFPVYYTSFPLPYLFPSPPQLFHFFSASLRIKNKTYMFKQKMKKTK